MISYDGQLNQQLIFYLLSMNELTVFMNSRAAIMKKLYLTIAFILLTSGCSFQKPDYLNMINAAELNQIMQREDIFLADVHIPEQPHIKGTDLFIPYNEIEKYKDKLPKDKNTAIYIYCRSGSMGNAAARSLHELGYRNLFNLEGGAEALKKAGFAFQ